MFTGLLKLNHGPQGVRGLLVKNGCFKAMAVHWSYVVSDYRYSTLRHPCHENKQHILNAGCKARGSGTLYSGRHTGPSIADFQILRTEQKTDAAGTANEHREGGYRIRRAHC